MNRPNKSATKMRVTHNPTDAIQWQKEDPKEFAGGLVRAGYLDDAGYDLCASRTVTVPANAFAQIPTNIKIATPEGTWGLIVGRSSTFFRRQLLVQSAVIDGGYRGPIWSVVKNLSDQPVIVRKGERVSQLILMPLIVPEVREVQELPASDRGQSGFGSTGIEIDSNVQPSKI